MTPKICVSVLPKTTKEALRLVARAEESGADLVEVRLDQLENLQGLADVAAKGTVPMIATNKQPALTDRERQQTLLQAAKSGFIYVDLDLAGTETKAVVQEMHVSGAKCIVSFHNYQDSLPLPELNRILEQEIAAGADVCKIVVTPKTLTDNLTLLQFTQTASAKTQVVCFGMGELGRSSRLLSPVYGGAWTFAALESGGETAPGQMTLKEMRTVYELLRLN